MAEIIDNIASHDANKEYASNSKGNAGLTLGIIGTALGAMSAIGSGFSLFGGSSKSGSPTNGTTTGESAEALNLERTMNADYVAITKQYYEGKIDNIKALADQFYKLDKQDTDNSFMLYKLSRDNKDELSEKINNLQAKVDVMAAVRPYQDALIDARIREAEGRSDFNLFRRTCRMIEGQLVLGDSSIAGFPSYSPWVNN